jgi:uncharacterized protein YsxB (DUF464 family)
MIYAEFNAEDDEFELKVNGHANYSNNGNDIVCAAASTIVYTLLGYLNNVDEVNDLDYIDRSGDFSLVCSGQGERIKAAIDMALIGFLQLEHTYPQCVRVKK